MRNFIVSSLLAILAGGLANQILVKIGVSEYDRGYYTSAALLITLYTMNSIFSSLSKLKTR